MKNLYTLAVNCYRALPLIILLFLTERSIAQESMRANIYALDANGTYLMDGNLTEYNNNYSNEVDIFDAWKMTNPGVNFGILRSGYNLSVERRSVIGINDTTFFRMWNMPRSNYMIRFMLTNLNHPGILCSLKDNYLSTETPIALNDTTDFLFTVDTNPASANEMRFQLIFSTSLFTPVDVNFTTIQAVRRLADIQVNWEVANETSIQSYSIEHSYDGRNFTNIKQLTPSGNSSTGKSYNYLDPGVSKGEHFYRIKATSLGGRIQYSSIAKVGETGLETGISIYPNPVANKNVQVLFNKLPAGNYNITLLYGNGMQLPLSAIRLSEGQVYGNINLPSSLAPGIYRLQFTGPGNSRIIKTINVQ